MGPHRGFFFFFLLKIKGIKFWYHFILLEMMYKVIVGEHEKHMKRQNMHIEKNKDRKNNSEVLFFFGGYPWVSSSSLMELPKPGPAPAAG